MRKVFHENLMGDLQREREGGRGKKQDLEALTKMESHQNHHIN